MNLRTVKIPLIGRIIIAIVLGIGAGYCAPVWCAELMSTFNGIFSQFLGFIIPLLILGFVAPAIADIGSSAGKMLAVTALIAYIMTLLSGLFSYGVGAWIFPSLITPGTMNESDLTSTLVAPWFTVDIPPVFSVMTALVLAFVAGLGIAYTRSSVLLKGFNEFRDIITLVINGVIIPLLPIYIFGIFMNMTVEGKVGTVIATFVSIIIAIFILHILLLLGQFTIAGIVTRRNPLPLLRTMLPAYFTALGTQSSAATIPVTLRQSIATGVRPSIAGFVIPLCATIHMSGSTLKIVACALALMIMQGIPYTTPMFIGFIAMLGITIVAAPGVPGGAIMASLGLLSSMLGFSEADNALMIALYIAMDSFGTACNVTGDGAISLIIDRIFGSKTDAQANPAE